MTSTNPYALQFGQEPNQMIPREYSFSEITNTFQSEESNQHIFMITGIRGSGKTVFMTNVTSSFDENKWIIINVNVSSQKSVLEQIVIHLANHKKFKKHIHVSSVSASLPGINIQLNQKDTITSPEYEAEQLLKLSKKLNYKILITIDEVTNTDFIREFTGAFQIWLRENLPVYLLMTGLYENIRELQDDKSSTFLYRSPRIDLSPLQLSAIKDNYKKNLNISDETAREMAKNTLGYSFAFQALGYVVWNIGKYNEEAIQRYKTILADFSYDKIWSELSRNDQRVCYAIAESKTGKYSELKEILHWNGNQLNPYRKRLLEKQVVYCETRGYLSFTLPLFKDYIFERMSYEDE